jgi:hypothetical protein
MPTTKTVRLRPTLLEAWLHYCVIHNCEDGQRAQQFLRGCLNKGIVEDAKVWEAAPQAIKDRFYQEFGWPDLPKEVKEAQASLDAANRALNSAKAAKLPAATLKLIEAAIKDKQAAVKAAQPKGLHPRGWKLNLYKKEIVFPVWPSK